MKHLIDATRQGIAQKNWYASLLTALAIPDICAALIHSSTGPAKYVDWAELWLCPSYVDFTRDAEKEAVLEAKKRALQKVGPGKDTRAFLVQIEAIVRDMQQVPRISRTILTGADVYAFRCTFLHQGHANIEGQRVGPSLHGFDFVFPTSGMLRHRNWAGDELQRTVLQLQVDVFCEDVCQAAEAWLGSVGNDATIQKRIGEMLIIKPSLPVDGG